MAELLNEDIVKQIQEVFTGLKQPVHVLFFGSKENCQYCDETRQLAEEVVATSEKLSIAIYDVDADADLAEKYHVEGTPAMIIAAKEGDQVTDFGVRLMGIPSGHEFTSFIQDILLVSNRDSGLNPQTREFLKGLNKPVLLQVFVTPT